MDTGEVADEGVLGMDWLALARGTLDRAAEHRRDESWVATAWADPATRVLVVHEGRALVRDADTTPTLVQLRSAEAPEGERYLLGVDPGGVAHFAVSAPLPAMDDTSAGGLRKFGAVLGDRDAGLLTQAVGLQNWHSAHTHCPRCGTPTRVASAGHTRVCPADGSEHFPRVDPAVIMLVHDGRGRTLLARGAPWPPPRRSVLAGFVEPGESLEQAVAREVHEEVGLRVRDVRYLGSQPWPLPRSLMLGFFARAVDADELRVDGEEIADARWFTRDGLLAAVEAGELVLPGKVSIARQLIEQWYGASLDGGNLGL